MDLAALQAAMNRDYNSDSGSGSSYAGSQPEMTEDADQPDEDFGPEPLLELPFPEDIMDHTFKGKTVEHLYLEQYDESDCKGCWFACHACSRSDYYARFHASRITMEDQGKFLNVTGLEYFICDTSTNLTDSMLFRKDGKITAQPVKVRYNEDQEAQLTKVNAKCQMRLEDGGIVLTKRCDIVGEEVLNVMIKYNEDTEELFIDNVRITSSSRQKSQVIGWYDLAKFEQQKNKDFL